MDHALRQEIIEVLEQGRDLTLATLRADGAPQATTVSYVSDGLSIYFGCGARSQKASNLARDDRVSLAIDLPYADWNEIRGLSLFGRARPLTAPADIEAVGRLFRARFPQMAAFAEAPFDMTLFCITPQVVSVLDYRKGFGHTELVTAAELETAPAQAAAG
ncbi:MAG: pyridoxamine 5'-phosphate oxidase family protein [Brevundimonas sp.]|uniref:pyridoxamine 5'-phosphate oxidase family protein n=1 Tax=Brevundimonas sp. TaxID=1871086 RepID=UPI001837C225|nr:pyridoxamine 5'-phosphate oxidase family protein [Brevundimonas sp.]MBA4805148.1 pyridoxamine 5'-phosphate oxidase family protein [Brevundimonas sp.]